jgi:YD repeat-containing protein
VAWAANSGAQRAATPASALDFDARGDLVRITEADGSRRCFAYDDQRRLVRVQDSRGSTHYHYDAHDRLQRVAGPAGERRHVHDDAGRLVEVHRGAAGGIKYQYDAAGRVLAYRTAQVGCSQAFDAAGRVVQVAQEIGGVRLQADLDFDVAGRLATLQLPGGRQLAWQWDARGLLAGVQLDGRQLARWQRAGRAHSITTAGGVVQRTLLDDVDARVLETCLRRGGVLLAQQQLQYDTAARVVHDGERSYSYDAQGRLAAEVLADGQVLRQRYGAAGERLASAPPWAHEHIFDGNGELAEVRCAGATLARMAYDAKGRLAQLLLADREERYLYGPADELLAVCDALGRPLRLYVHTPAGCVAEVEGDAVHFLHLDRRGASATITGLQGEVLAQHALDAWGAPADPDAAGPAPWFGGRRYVAALRLYRCGARWYDPHAGLFLTPDSHTAAPDDERLLHPLLSGAAQVALRGQLLAGWLRQASSRQPFAFCANDPVNRVDPDGHWSFGGVVLSLLGAIWTLPNTLFGLLIEITCLVGEVVRWLVWLFSGGNVSWATPGFDAAASSQLNAFALVFRGGWLGSFRSLLGITFGNVFFVYHDWENLPELAGGGQVQPPAYGGSVSIPLQDALYEHELRHTNQYGWLGPFFHLGLPLFGFYEWDVIFNGYQDALLETDAREHAGF